MTKYSTGSSGGSSEGSSCELCGEATDSLELANVAGAKLHVCTECAPHDDAQTHSQSRSDVSATETSRRQRTAQNQAQMYDQVTGDSTHWEEGGTEYESDQLPYLVSDYGKQAESARQQAGLTVEELATELGIEKAEIMAVEQGRATRAGIGGTVIRTLESRLSVTLRQETETSA